MIHADVLGERARLTPDKTALVVVATGERLTYRELDERAVRCARAWQALGLAKGDRVAILAHNRVEYLEAFFAAPKTGVVLVPLGTRLTAGELAQVVRDAGVAALLYDGELADTARALRERVCKDPPRPESTTEHVGEELVSSRGGGGRRTAGGGKLRPYMTLGARAEAHAMNGGARVAVRPESGCTDADGSPHWIALDRPLAPGDASYRELTAAADPAGFARVPCDPEDLYCLLYTSGTTGRPKGVMIPHRMVAWNGYNTVSCWQLREDDVSPVFTPLYHAGGLMAFLVPIFVIGGTIVLHRGFDPAEVWRTLQAEGCTVVLGVPTIWKLLMEAPEFQSADLSRVRWLISGGAPLPHYIAEAYQARGAVFKQGFGMTEVGVNCFAMTAEDSIRKLGSIGRPMMFTEVRLIDEEGREVAPGEVGEMLFRGPHVCRGYWNQPEATAAALDAEGWFHSGDLARRDEDGFFYVAGRKKDMIISGGVNVYPAEIEAALVLHPRVQDAAVVGVPDDKWGEVGVAFVVPRPGAELTPDELAAHLEERLAHFKVPKHYRFLDELPRTAYGKVVKGELKERFLSVDGPGGRA